MTAAAVLLLAAWVPGGGEADAVLRSLGASGRRLHTLSADFVQTKVSVLLDEKEETRGTVLLSVPGRLKWTYAAPEPSAMLIKEGRFARYFPATKQVFRGEARGEADLLVGFGPGAADLSRKYEVTLVGEEQVDGIATHVLDLKSRPGKEGLFAGIRLWVEKSRAVPVQTRLTEPTGDHTTIRFLKAVINGKLPSDAFELKLPRDVVEVQ